jgi:hypothetical protein
VIGILAGGVIQMVQDGGLHILRAIPGRIVHMNLPLTGREIPISASFSGRVSRRSLTTAGTRHGPSGYVACHDGCVMARLEKKCVTLAPVPQVVFNAATKAEV